jgi:hypothetical protein
MAKREEEIMISTDLVSELAIANYICEKHAGRIGGAELERAFKLEARKDFSEKEISKISDHGIRMVMGKAMRRLGYKASLINGCSVYRGLALRAY